MGFFSLENTQPRRNSRCLFRCVNLSGGKKGRAGAALPGANTSISGKFSKKKQSKDGVSSARLPSASSPDDLQPLWGLLNQSSRVSDECVHAITPEQVFFPPTAKCKGLMVYFAQNN